MGVSRFSKCISIIWIHSLDCVRKWYKRGVYCINEQGGVHLIAGVDSNFSTSAKSGQDVVITQIGGSEQSINIAGKLKTRMYTYGDIGRKKI